MGLGRVPWQGKSHEGAKLGSSVLCPLSSVLCPLSSVLYPLASAAGGEGDDFEAGARFDEGAGVVAREDGLFVEFDDDGFAGEAEEIEQAVEEDGIGQGMGSAVEGDGG